MSPREDFSCEKELSFKNPGIWGINFSEICNLDESLEDLFGKFEDCFVAGNHNNWFYALDYALGMIELESNRNYVNISRHIYNPEDDGQSLQNFMSDSPWKAGRVFDEIQRQIKENKDFQGGFITIDESANARNTGKSAGVAWQYNGRLGKKECSQMGVCLTYQKDGMTLPIDGDLYLTQEWFTAKRREQWPSLHIPPDTKMKKKTEIALEMILRAKRNGLPFKAVCGDDAYGHSFQVRRSLYEEGIKYILDVPGSHQVYLEEPVLGIPSDYPGKSGPKFRKQNVIFGKPVKMNDLARTLSYKRVEIRPAERGVLCYDVASVLCWTVSKKRDKILRENLLIRRDSKGCYHFSLSNLCDLSLDEFARWKAHRYYVERAFQDAKSELGWDEICAVKYRSWMHHTAIISLTLWFFTILRLKMHLAATSDGRAFELFDVDILPMLSISCLRILVRACYGDGFFNLNGAVKVVAMRMKNRIKSRKSRLKTRHGPNKPKNQHSET